MVRFSCFQGHVHSNKPKKNVQLSPDSIQKMSGVSSTDKALKGFTSSGDTNSSHLKVQEGIYNNSIVDVTNSSYAKSEDIGSKYDSESEFELNKTGRIIKSKSLGSGLDQKGKISCSNSDDEIDRGFSGDGSHDSGGSAVPSGHCQALLSESLRVISDKVNDLSIFSIGDLEQSEKEDRVNSSVEGDGETNDPTPLTPPVIMKSKSLSNLGSYGRSSSAHFKPLSTCSEDLNLSESRLKVRFIHAITAQEIQDQERDDTVLNGKKNNCENSVDRGKYADDCTNSAKDRIIPMKLESNVRTAVRGEPSVFRLSDLPGEDFKIKRIEEWVMDLQQGGPPEGTDELLTSSDDGRLRAETVLHNSTTARLDNKAIPGMEAAKKYISSLSASATAAQLSNRGLLLIPVLSAFVSLRVLNLSGNSVVRITASALPRGLHVLNLSKNHISTIEGLRELTRLRVLDLSYNRLLKIGHGLSYCSSLKELYLAGNKISEVEGLHRLLKLNVLDLRFNKISTTKCLGQLAANYNSLHALSLEGNPAHKNVGDEQIKKFVLALLPHLAYFNRQCIKPGCSKDGPDRSARLGITSHQTDRSLRSELKTRRGSQGRRSEAVTTQKTSRGKYGKIPLGGIKTANQRHHFYDFGGKLLNFTPDLSIHRSRSAGNLAAL